MIHIKIACVALAAIALTGCPAETKPVGGASGSASASGASAVGSAGPLSDAQLDEVDIPTEQEFEEEAEKKISADNYLDELDKLEGEIDNDKE